MIYSVWFAVSVCSENISLSGTNDW